MYKYAIHLCLHVFSTHPVSSDLATQQLDVTFGSGMQRACGGVQVVDDAVVEEDEVVALNISETAGVNKEGQVMFLVGERAQVVMEIRDDDGE